MRVTRTLTHKGWFGFCPVYLGDLDGPAPLVVERHFLLLPLFMLNEFLMAATFLIAESIKSEPQYFRIMVTGVLKTPKTVTGESA